MSRLYGEKENLDSEKIKEFFNNRTKKDVESILSITMYQDKENVEKRHKEDVEMLLSHISLENKKILEVGSGVGRWAEVFYDKCKEYLGIDYSEELVKIAKENYNYNNCFFQEMSATDIKKDELLVNPPFDVIVISGVLLYLNDDDIKKMIEELNKVITKDTVFYIRETISVIGDRLTLKDFFSEDLGEEYNSVYRTENEFLDLFEGINNITNIKSFSVFEDLGKHTETKYHLFILE